MAASLISLAIEICYYLLNLGREGSRLDFSPRRARLATLSCTASWIWLHMYTTIDCWEM
jgi:hypothetical protein